MNLPVKRNRFLFWVRVALLSVLTANLIISSVQAQTVSPPVAVESTSNAFIVEVLTSVEQIRPDEAFDMTVKITANSLQDGCYGIPALPANLFIVVDNSGSAGNNQGSNLWKTRALLQDFLTQADQPIYTNPNYANLQPVYSRFGLVSSTVGTTGTELSVQSSGIVSDTRVAIAQIQQGSDTEIADGIERALTEIRTNFVGNYLPVLLLMLHDNVALTPQTLTAIRNSRDKGIEIFVFVNSTNIAPEKLATLDGFAGTINPENFFIDPTPEQMRQAFIMMTHGTKKVARTVQVTHRWQNLEGQTNSPIQILSVVTANTRQTSNSISANFRNFDPGKFGELEYRAKLYPGQNPENIQSVVELNYLDCNGFPRAYQVPFWLEVNPILTPTPTTTFIPPSSTAPAPESGTAIPGTEQSQIAASPTITPDAFIILSPTNEQNNTMPNGLPWLNLPPSPVAPEFIGGIFSFLGPLLAGLPTLLQWLALFLLLLLLLWLLWLLWRWLRNRSHSNSPSSPRSDPNNLPKKNGAISVKSTLPQWLQRLNQPLSLVTQNAEKTPLHDTVLIGIGPAGREVLSQIATDLKNRFGEQLPENVRLLQIDVLPASESTTMTAPNGLTPEQYVLLRPNFKEVQENLQRDPEIWSHWAWYENAAPTYDRARGRIAIFYDLKAGLNNSSLWKRLERSFLKLNSPDVRIFGTTFDDVSSGMLVDIVRLVQFASGKELAAQLWLAGPVGQDWSTRLGRAGQQKLALRQQEARTLATLRELERFQRNAPVPFRYVPENNLQANLRAVHNYAVIQNVFLFESQAGALPERDVLAQMADTALALLHSRMRDDFTALLKQGQISVNEIISRTGEGMVSGLGCYTLRLPGVPLARTFAWRMVREVLFDQKIGLLPLEMPRLDNGFYEAIDLDDSQASSTKRDEIEKLIKSQVNQWKTPAFLSKVENKLDEFLNGESDNGEPTLNRLDGLERAKRWLETLVSVLKRSGGRDATPPFEAMIEQIEDWQTFLKEEVHPLVRARYEAARRDLADLNKQAARYWIIDENKLEWTAYQKSIRPNLVPTPNPLSEPLLRLAQRFGWSAHFDGTRASLMFLAPDRTFVFDPTVSLSEFQVKQDAESLLKSLYALAEPLAQLPHTEAVRAQIPTSQPPSLWLEKAKPRLTYNEADAARLRNGLLTQSAFVVMEESDQAKKIKEDLKFSQGASSFGGDVKLCESKDTTTISVIRVVDWVPMSALTMYSSDNWQKQNVPASLYVWSAEQRAAEIEGNSRLSSRFLGWLTSDEQLFDLMMSALLYNITSHSENQWNIPGIGQVEAASECDVFESLFGRSRPVWLGDPEKRKRAFETLKQAIETHKQEFSGQRLVFLKSREADYVQGLIKSEQSCQQELGRYLQNLIESERRR